MVRRLEHVANIFGNGNHNTNKNTHAVKRSRK